PFTPNREVDVVEWLEPDAAIARMTQAHDAELVALALAEPLGTPLVVLRHAKARSRSSWKGSELERPLTRTGAKNAKALAPLLQAYDVRRLHPSTAVRSVRTVKPYARTAGLLVSEEPLLAEEAFESDPAVGLARAESLTRSTAVSGEATVLCTHRPVIPVLVSHLLEGSGLVGPTEPLGTAAMVVVHVDIDVAEGSDRVLAVETHAL
ncbi:MAG: histidine phosphatase family protein, partial [Actinomycetes bacterium]